MTQKTEQLPPKPRRSYSPALPPKPIRFCNARIYEDGKLVVVCITRLILKRRPLKPGQYATRCPKCGHRGYTVGDDEGVKGRKGEGE